MARTKKQDNGASAADSRVTDAIFTPIKSKRAFDEVSHEIKTLIFKGTLRPGDRLPSETELANRFSVGRQTIREALRLLELSGFITMQKGGAGGPLVADTILSSITNSFLDAFQIGKFSLEEHTKARIEIEKMVLNYALDRIEDADVKSLIENVEQARQKVERNEPAFEENIQFHRLLARASGNQVFFVVIESITAVVVHIRSILGLDVELTRITVKEHEKIVEAIVAGDKAKALDLLESHLEQVGERYKKSFGRKKKR